MRAGRNARSIALCAVFAILAIGGQAHAETSRSFDVSASIASGCAIDGFGSSGNAGNIGALPFDTRPSVATGTVQASLAQAVVLRCTPGVALTMAIDGGLHVASGSRHLQLGANSAARLAYRLCADVGCAQIIGIGQNIAVTVNSGNMNDVRLPIVGEVTLPGDAHAGEFTDTLTVTLSW